MSFMMAAADNEISNSAVTSTGKCRTSQRKPSPSRSGDRRLAQLHAEARRHPLWAIFGFYYKL
jgi:hypothetical protein